MTPFPIYSTVSWTTITVTVISFFIARAQAFGDASTELNQLTGVHVRVVWVQDQSVANHDTLALGKELKLMGLDNRDGRGERPLLGDIQNYAKPLLTPDGQRVVYSDRYSQEISIVNWDGSGKRRLGEGFAVEVWIDPTTRQTWVYSCSQVGKLDSINFKSLRRLPIDGGTRWEPVWDKTEISPDNFQLSADGTIAAGEFPWPNGGTANLTTKSYRKRADGCWASLAPDNSGLCWIFDGPHRNIYLYPRDSLTSWKVSLNTIPGSEKYEVFHPRWSNHVRFFSCTGPYKIKTAVNSIAGGGPEVEIYIGRFRDNFQDVENWARVTNNSKGDFFPDVWIEGGESSTIPSELFHNNKPVTETETFWPGRTDGLVFLWENANTQNASSIVGDRILPSGRIEPRGKAKFNRFFDMDCTGGSFVVEQAGHDLFTACQSTNELTIEVAITPIRTDQTGPARIISFGSNSSSRNFVLGQDHDMLTFELNTKPANFIGATRLRKLVANQLQHLVLTYSSAGLKSYMNGKPVEITSQTSGDFSGWSEQQLVFGADNAGNHNWSGKLEGIAFYHRALTDEEALRHFELFSGRLAHRRLLDRIRVRATCLEASQTPDPRTIVPYRRALIVSRYRIDKIIEGTVEGSEILVAQWGILDKLTIKDSKPRVGQTVELMLENFDDHPELKSERQIVDVEGLDLHWYYAIGK